MRAAAGGLSDEHQELTAFIKAYPKNEDNTEARILLADALMNEGRMDEGIAYLKSIPNTIADQGMYEEAVFKIAKAYKVMEEPEKYRMHMEGFRDTSPKSPRVAEAIYNIGWVYRQEGKPEKAREIYWEAITKYGNDAAIVSVDELFPALLKLYKSTDESGVYMARLRDLAFEADKKGQKTLTMRLLWAQAEAIKKTEPDRANQLWRMRRAGWMCRKASPRVMADIANALIATGKEKEGEQMWKDLVKWNPRAPQKDQALAALGLSEMKRGDEKKALEYFDRFEKETMGSLLFGKIMLAKTDLLTVRGQKDDARKTLDTLLANNIRRAGTRRRRCSGSARCYMKDDKPDLAVPYYQRVYVMYGRWRDWVAKSYLRSGEAFEKLKDKDARPAELPGIDGKRNDGRSGGIQKSRAERLQALGGPLAEGRKG